MSDTLDLDARRRIRYRSGHRGLRELDLLLGGFVDVRGQDFDDRDIADFERLLDVPDQTVLAWLMGETPVDPACDTPVWQALRAFHG